MPRVYLTKPSPRNPATPFPPWSCSAGSHLRARHQGRWDRVKGSASLAKGQSGAGKLGPRKAEDLEVTSPHALARAPHLVDLHSESHTPWCPHGSAESMISRWGAGGRQTDKSPAFDLAGAQRRGLAHHGALPERQLPTGPGNLGFLRAHS